MIIKVRFKEPSGTVEGFVEETILFGNSYKKWQEQYIEYVRLFKAVPVQAWKSKAEWKGWGGLKWCRDEDFQEELNREGVQDGEQDNLNPRQYSEMLFEHISLDDLPKK